MTAPTPPGTAYEQAVRRVWGALYETEDTDAVPEWVRNPAGFRLERARRLAAVASALTTRLPTAAFLYLAGEGTPGIARFLTDRAWRTREREPGADFPPASSTARAFAAYLEHGWPAHRPAWQWELASAETDLAYRPPLPSSAALAAGVRPAPGTRLRVSPYDTDDYGRRTAVKKRQLPWELVLQTVRPVERPTAILVPGGGPGAGRPLVLHDDEAAALAWLTDGPREPRVAGRAPDEELLHRLTKVGALVRTGDGR